MRSLISGWIDEFQVVDRHHLTNFDRIGLKMQNDRVLVVQLLLKVGQRRAPILVKRVVADQGQFTA